MDGVSAAASVITVLGVALSSAQILYNAVSNIQDAPDAILRIASYLKSLSKLLQQLSAMHHSGSLANDLDELIRNCAAHLKTLKDKLGKLITSSGNRRVRLWKNIKYMVQEKHLEKLADLLQQDLAALLIQLSIIEGQRSLTHTASLGRIEEHSTTQIAQHSSHALMLERAVDSTNQTDAKLQAFKTTAETSQNATQQALERLEDRIQGLSATSKGQADTILELLTQRLSVKSSDAASCSTSPMDGEALEERDYYKERQERLQDDQSLRDAVDRLCRGVKDKETSMFSEDVDEIVADVQQLLNLLLKAEAEESQNRKGKRSICSYENDFHYPQYQKEVNRIKAVLITSPCIAFNEQASRPRTTQTALYKRSHHIYQGHSRHGTVMVQTRRRRRTSNDPLEHCTDNLRNEIQGYSEASFVFQQSSPGSDRVSVLFQQTLLHTGSFLTKSILSVSKLLPRHSKVFRLVARGDLEELKKSLSLREVRLTDRDEDGRCLLNYALHYSQPNICKFLLEHGADVDFWEPSWHYSAGFDNPFIVHKYDKHPHSPDRSSSDDCELHLFEAGTDPTVGLSTGRDIRWDFRKPYGGHVETIRLLLDHGMDFLKTSESVSLGDFLINHLESSMWTANSVRLILTRQGKAGFPAQNLNSSLVTALRGTWLAGENDMKEVLVLLLEAGADIHEIFDGMSVSDFACDRRTGYTMFSPSLGNDTQYLCNRDMRLKEIWSDALKAYGYSAGELSDLLDNSERLDREDSGMSTRREGCGSDICWLCPSEGYRDSHVSGEIVDLTQSDTDDEGLQQSESDCASPREQSTNVSEDEEQSDIEGVSSRTEFPAAHQYEQLLLEDDAQVWRN